LSAGLTPRRQQSHHHHHQHDDHVHHDERYDEREHEHDDDKHDQHEDNDSNVIITNNDISSSGNMSNGGTSRGKNRNSSGRRQRAHRLSGDRRQAVQGGREEPPTVGAEMPTPQPDLPPGTKKVVIFDTNAYRGLGRAKAQVLKQRENECGVLALANPVVMLELASHLADKKDRHYKSCMSALAALAMHTKKPNSTGLCYCPEPRSDVCHQLFGKIPRGDEQRVKDMGALAVHVNEHYPDIANPQMLKNFRTCADQVKQLETQWTEQMKRLHAPSKAVDVQRWEDALANFIVAMCASAVCHLLTVADINHHTSVIRTAYAAPLRMMSLLLQKLTTVPPASFDNPAKKWGNYLWDFLICFAVGGDHAIKNADVYLVTGDQDIVKASVAAGCGDRVLSLQEHLTSVGLS